MEYLEILKTYILWSNRAYDYLLFLFIFIGAMIALKLFQFLFLARLRRLAKRTKTDFDDLLISLFSGLRPPFYLFIALYFAGNTLFLSDWLRQTMRVLFFVVIVVEVVQVIIKLFDYFFDKYLARRARQEGAKVLTLSMSNTLKFFVKLLLWMIGILMVLSNLGINVTSIMASLGIGGIAVALAAQNILSDIFSAFSIYFDRPFEIGDYIQCGVDAGTVEKIGLKTTRLRTMQGEELIISNKELTNARVQNFKRMEERRVVIQLGVEYGTDLKLLEQIPNFLENIVVALENVRFDRCFFVKYEDSSLMFELVYFVGSADYVDYLAVNQTINLAIYKKFTEEKIAFAYPSQTVYLKK